jgi:site-specific DNA recombinase
MHMKTTVQKAHTAVMYARVSSKDQEREGFSIPAQQKLLREYAIERGLSIVREFKEAETAKEAGRGAFTAMIAFLKATPSCRTILVEKTDRLYRNFRDLLAIEDLGVSVHFVKENTILSAESRSSEKLMHNIKVAIARNYVDNLSEEVKKGLREKADQGHFPGVAHVGYVNNPTTRRIDVDAVRGPLMARVFELYASGEYSLKALTAKAYEIGLRHSRGDRKMTKSELHRLLKNPIYVGDFRWLGKVHRGSHEALVSRETFDRVQEVLEGKGRKRRGHRKHHHPFMGLLKCGLCGCTMTAERKKGKYVYYRCTGFKGACGNVYIRQEKLSDLLGDVIKPIQITADIAAGIANALRASDGDAEAQRLASLQQVDQRRRTVVSKLDRGYEDFASGRISETFWTRKSSEWEAELQTVDAERARLEATYVPTVATAEKILELAKKAENLYKSQNPAEQRRLLETVLSNCTFDRGSLKPTYTSPFDLLVKGNETGNWRRGWDSNPTGFFGFCKLQIPHCRHCRGRHRCRGTLHAVARTHGRVARSRLSLSALRLFATSLSRLRLFDLY